MGFLWYTHICGFKGGVFMVTLKKKGFIFVILLIIGMPIQFHKLMDLVPDTKLQMEK